MTTEQLITRMSELNNLYLVDQISLEELYELNDLAKQLFYLTAENCFHRDPARKQAYEAQFDSEGNTK